MSAGLLATARTLGGAFRARHHATVESPEVSTADALVARKADWALLDRWYEATRIYDESDPEFGQRWRSHKSVHNLPIWIRAIFNPVPRAVDWYAGHLFRGAWTEDGRPLPDGTPHMLPVPEDVLEARPLVVAAAMQALAWSNFRSVLFAFLSQLALHGNAFFEVNDDTEGEPERRKVKAELIPLWQVADVTLNAGGDVKSYTLAFTHRDRERTYTYRKVVDDLRTRIYHDDELVETVDHGYGFCPGVWVPFRLRGSRVFGSSLVQGLLPKIDQVNALHAIVAAYINKSLSQPMVYMGTGRLRLVVPATERTDADGKPVVAVEEGTVPLLFFDGPDGRIQPLMGTLDVADANARLAAQMEDVERDLPEITMDRELRGVSQLTGPGADRVMSDVRARYTEVMGNVDASVVKLMQMLVTIGCHRANSGAWDGGGGALTRQQAKFRITETRSVVAADDSVTWEDSGEPVGLGSYGRGAIDLALVPRPLVEDVLPQEGTEEFARMRQMQVNYAAGLRDLTKTELKFAGVSGEEAEALLGERDEQDADAERLLNRGAIASEAV